MDSLGALALATGRPHPNLLKRNPQKRKSPLISSFMIMNIVSQALFQIIIAACLLVFHNGKLLDSGSPDEIFSNDTLLETASLKPPIVLSILKNPEILRELPKDCCVVICNIYYREIEVQLREMGIENIGYFNDEYMPSFYFDRLDNE